MSGWGGGWSSQVVVANEVILEGSGDALLVYNGTPAPGNLIDSIAPASVTEDPFNFNPVQGGAFAAYTGSSPVLSASLDGSGVFWTWNTGATWNTAASITSIVVPLSPSNTVILCSVDSVVTLEITSTGILVPLITAFKPGSPPGTPETWHPISLASGWSTVAGFPVPSYRLMPDGTVEITGRADHAAFVSDTTLSGSALPAAYQPLTTQYVGGNPAGSASIQIGSTGTITAKTNASVTACIFNGTYPLNL